MTFELGVGEFIALSGLAARVYTAYKYAPDDYRHISEELLTLKGLIDKAAQHFKSTNISHDDRYYGQKVLKDCQKVLENLHTFIEKYKNLASIFTRVKLGRDIAALQVRLMSYTALLKGFVRRFVVPTITLHYTHGY